MPAISHESYVHKSHLYKQTMDTLNLVTFSGHFGGSFSVKATRNLAQKTLCEEIGQKIKAWNLRQPEVLAQKGAAFWPRPETMQLGAFTRAIEDSIKNYMGPNPNRPRSGSCNRAVKLLDIQVSGSIQWVLLVISWKDESENLEWFGGRKYHRGFCFCLGKVVMFRNFPENVGAQRFIFEDVPPAYPWKLMVGRWNFLLK